jgi:hypothetical protein
MCVFTFKVNSRPDAYTHTHTLLNLRFEIRKLLFFLHMCANLNYFKISKKILDFCTKFLNSELFYFRASFIRFFYKCCKADKQIKSQKWVK